MPFPFERIQKIFKLEISRGYDNKAVVGGLDKVATIWEEEARQQQVGDDLIQKFSVELSRYENYDHEVREKVLNEIFSLMSEFPVNKEPDRISYPEDSSNEVEDRVTQINKNLSYSPTQTPAPPDNKMQYEAAKPRYENKIDLGLPLTEIQGIGNSNSQKLRQLGLFTVFDLIHYYPRRYDDYSQLKPINRLAYGDELTVLGIIKSIDCRPIKKSNRKLDLIEAVISDGTGYLRLIWFNKPYLLNVFPAGSQVVVSGKIDEYLGRLVINNPEMEKLDKEQLHTNRIVPVYSLAGDITQHNLRGIMFRAINQCSSRLQDHLPESIKRSAQIMDLSTAIIQIHFPESQEKMQAARARLAFDEILLLQLGVLRQKYLWQNEPALRYNIPGEVFEQYIQKLPFSLTNAQKEVISEIQHDFVSGRPMNRLLQGDVGSGKTIVAALSSIIIAQNNAQTAILAPTSILAEQHFQTLSRLFPSLDVLKENEIKLLTGGTPDSEKAKILEDLSSGQIKLIIGTHALLEEPVIFQNLQFAVIDEQHRFGVKQRAILRSKGNNPHLLVMTATPIPRSLALTVYGDLDLSLMMEIPSGRKPIETYVLIPSERHRAYNLINSQIKQGHQAFIIYPLIEQGEQEDVKAAVEEYDRIKREIFPDLNLGLIHGRLKSEEKDKVMADFRDNKYQVLISTSVVEVGVDIPNATVMLVEGANRFGLAQLHQFRGRVGRGEAQSYCLLIPETENSIENERLTAMTQSNDGFVLAERDLAQRGPGDFLGTRQSGFTELKLATLTDLPLIEKARQHAVMIFESDPTLNNPENTPLNHILKRYWGENEGDIS
jgi:ATP-dependent DNA helicase RecG